MKIFIPVSCQAFANQAPKVGSDSAESRLPASLFLHRCSLLRRAHAPSAAPAPSTDVLSRSPPQTPKLGDEDAEALEATWQVCSRGAILRDSPSDSLYKSVDS